MLGMGMRNECATIVINVKSIEATANGLVGFWECVVVAPPQWAVLMLGWRLATRRTPQRQMNFEPGFNDAFENECNHNVRMKNPTIFPNTPYFDPSRKVASRAINISTQ